MRSRHLTATRHAFCIRFQFQKDLFYTGNSWGKLSLARKLNVLLEEPKVRSMQVGYNAESCLQVAGNDWPNDEPLRKRIKALGRSYQQLKMSAKGTTTRAKNVQTQYRNNIYSFWTSRSGSRTKTEGTSIWYTQVRKTRNNWTERKNMYRMWTMNDWKCVTSPYMVRFNNAIKTKTWEYTESTVKGLLRRMFYSLLYIISWPFYLPEGTLTCRYQDSKKKHHAFWIQFQKGGGGGGQGSF
jgi:hypothetical protein